MSQQKQIIELPDFITVRELADLIDASPIDVMKELISNGIMASINQQIDFDTAAIVADGLGYEARAIAEAEPDVQAEKVATQQWRRLYEGQETELIARPPVVTMLGHVDHGKTSLLDAIRKTHVQEGEAGGITQHIGAYQVTLGERVITFLDTPGHEAFTAMRSRGAQGADIAVLVVAADDGVMPTTREALAHVRAAHVPVVVALNKIDRSNANPDRVKQQMATELDLRSDEWGGDTLVVPVSARSGEGLADLLEAILLVADETDIRANPKAAAAGTVLDGHMTSARGPVATLLVQNGTLRTGDIVAAGMAQGRIKAMFDEFGKQIREAGPSQPVSVMGLNEPPHAGDMFTVVQNIKEARALIEERQLAASAALTPKVAMSLEEVYNRFLAGEARELLLIIKVDVDGSLEPVVKSVENVQMGDLRVRVLHADVGEITENDVNLAAASDAVVIGFNVDADSPAARLAEAQGVEIRTYKVIYHLIEAMELALQGLLEPQYEDRQIGEAEVRMVIRVPRVGNIAGSYVVSGTIQRRAKARVVRMGEIVADNVTVSSLKRFEEDVREVRTGFECGIGLESFQGIQEGDRIQFFVRERSN